jgi:acyl-CoA thioesterase I
VAQRVVAGLLLLAAACAPQDGDSRDRGRADESLAVAPRADGSTAAATPDSVATRTAPGNLDGAPVILFVGTSLTAGYGLPQSQAYPALVERMLDSLGTPARVLNAGVSGETSAGALRRIDWVLETPADVIVLETGANDGLRGIDVASASRNIQSILDRIRAKQPSARVLLVQMESPPNMGATYTAAFRAMFPSLARRNGVELMPFLLDGVAGHDTLNQADGIHPNMQGARIVAASVVRALLAGPGLRRASTTSGGE